MVTPFDVAVICATPGVVHVRKKFAIPLVSVDTSGGVIVPTVALTDTGVLVIPLPSSARRKTEIVDLSVPFAVSSRALEKMFDFVGDATTVRARIC